MNIEREIQEIKKRIDKLEKKRIKSKCAKNDWKPLLKSKNPTQRSLGRFMYLYLKHMSVPYIPNYSKDGNIVKAILKVYSEKQLKDIIKAFFEMAKEPECWHKDKLEVGVLKSQITKCVSYLKE